MQPILLSLGPVKIYAFGVLMALGVLLGAFVSWKKALEFHIEEDQFFDTLLMSIVGGLLGGRLFYVIEHLANFADKWLRVILVFAYPGLSWWGGAICGALVLWWQIRKNKDVHLWFDLASLGVSVGLVFGRIGSLLNGSMVGLSTTSILGVKMVGEGDKVWPIQIVEALAFVFLMRLLWSWESKYRTFFWYRGGRSSAKTGFLFYSFLVGMGLILGLGSLGYQWGSAWVAGMYRVGAVVSVLVGLMGLYVRSGRSLEADLGFKKMAG